ncbi:adenylate kinase isoenzyme 1 isoform X1 [Nomia melanderi]|uniref:adenylate kinase isoenzyme 1 isoform X1 n=2 Tax=Nomia melanderi TaxID=2448451 RepID=UPI003FCCC4D3
MTRDGSDRKTETLCMKLAEKYGFLHILASEVIRQEIMTRTERAFTLARMMSQGQLVPTDILVELIAIKMLNNLYNKNGVILSGFPKRKEQCKSFDTAIRPPDIVLYLNVRNSVLSDRIMGRIITTTERPMISYEEIKNQIKEFHKRNRLVIKHYKERLINIDGEFDAIKVYEDACNAIDNVLMKTSSTASSFQPNL